MAIVHWMHAIRDTKDGQQLLDTDSIYNLTLKRVTILVVCADREWHPLSELAKATEAQYENYKHSPLYLQYKTPTLDIDDILWLEHKALIEVARWKRHDGKLYVNAPMGAMRMCEVCNKPNCDHTGRRILYNNGKLIRRW